jgi:hypothetical protein
MQKQKQVLDMPTMEKVVKQVQCQACNKSMSAKNLSYSLSKYCTERNQEAQPEEIPVPKISFKNDKEVKERTTLPVKRVQKHKLQSIITQVPPSPPPPPPKTEQYETPGEFWKHTINNMKEKRLTQYKNLCSSAF